MKSGVALGAKLAAEISEPSIDVTWIFYDNEEVESAKNGLGLLGTAHPEWIQGDFAIVGEPTNAMVEGGCNGTIRVEVSTTGRQAHSAGRGGKECYPPRPRDSPAPIRRMSRPLLRSRVCPTARA